MRKIHHSCYLCIMSFTEKMVVHFDMLGALIINKVGSDVNCTGIISMKRIRCQMWKSKFSKYFSKPNDFRASCRYCLIFIVYGGLRCDLASPRNQSISKDYALANSGMPSIHICSQSASVQPIRVVGEPEEKNIPLFNVPCK